MSHYLPEGIIANILSRLPAKSILRFRFSCKSWFKLFNNPNFIKLHLKYANQRNSINLLIGGDDDQCMYVSRNIDTSSLSTTCVKTNNNPFKSPFQTLILGSCDGLVCLDVDDTVICFWNPTTNECKNVSKPESCYSSKIRENPRKWSLVCGLGYDSNNDDYKFVMISYTTITENEGLSISTEMYLYSLRSNSWRIVEYNISSYFRTNQCGVFLNGVLHWEGCSTTLSETGFTICCHILAFDIRNATFNLNVPKPKEFDQCKYPSLQISVMGDRLCMFSKTLRGREYRCLDVWVMTNYGVRESWTKLFTMLDEFLFTPIHIFKDGEILFERRNLGLKTLFLYDPKQKCARLLEINGVPEWQGIQTYSESLVSPNNTGLEEEFQ